MAIYAHYKQVTTEAFWGHVEIKFSVDSFEVWYHNHMFKGSPFKCPITFAKSFTHGQILNSSEVIKFLDRFN